MEKIKAAFENEETTLNPNVKKKSSYVDYYGDLVSQIANSGYVYRSIATKSFKPVQISTEKLEEVSPTSGRTRFQQYMREKIKNADIEKA